MSVDPSGTSTPKASVDAPRAAGPKRPPRPSRPEPEADVTTTDGPATAEATATKVATPPPGFAPVARSNGTPSTKQTPVVSTSGDAESSDDEFDDASATAAAPKPAPSTAGRTRRGRRVKRVVRRIDLWSVLKLSLVVYTCVYLATMATLAATWGLLYSSGSIDKLQSFLEDVGLENFTFYGDQMFRACAAVGAVGVLAGTVVSVLATALVNVISEMTGGIRLVVIEEDVAR